MDEKTQNTTSGADGKLLRPPLPGWRKTLVAVGSIAVFLRLLLALAMHSGSDGKPSMQGPSAAGPAVGAEQPLPAWPLKAGDVLPFRPGDKNLANWGDDPNNEPLIVSKAVDGGDPVAPATTICVFAPDYVADVSQPGGSLRVDGQDLLAGWRVHWRGGDTVPDELKRPDYDPRCGQDAELLLTATQLHDLTNALAGLPKPPPEPGVKAGTTIAAPQR